MINRFNKILSLIISAYIVFVSISVLADEIDTVTIVGDLKSNLTLNTDNEYLFRRENIVPGETWQTNIEVYNTSNKEMEFSVISINPDNAELSNNLSLNIKAGDIVIFDGIYGNFLQNDVPSLTISGKEKITLHIQVGMLPSANNSMQNSSISSVWTFEAKVQKSSENEYDYSIPSDKINSTIYKSPGYIATNATYNIVCKDENGNIIYSDTHNALRGSSFVVKAPEIEGYSSSLIFKIVTLGENGQDVVFTYHTNMNSNYKAEANKDSTLSMENTKGKTDEKTDEKTEIKNSTTSEPINGEPFEVTNTEKDKTLFDGTSNKPVKTGNEGMAANTVLVPATIILFLIVLLIFFINRKKGK